MNQEKEQLFKEFQNEIWLFLDNDLPDNKMNFWQQKINEFPELQNYLEDIKSINNNFRVNESANLDTYKFEQMIDTAINHNSYKTKINDFFKHILSSETEFIFGKVAFASLLIVAAITIMYLSNRPVPVLQMTETINSEILDWDADFVDNQITKVENLLKMAKDDDYKKYYKYRMSSKKVKKNIGFIENNIDELKKEINNQKL